LIAARHGQNKPYRRCARHAGRLREHGKYSAKIGVIGRRLGKNLAQMLMAAVETEASWRNFQ
jgi:hypothetical protein